jgi:hypothetical protein
MVDEPDIEFSAEATTTDGAEGSSSLANGGDST